MTVARTMRSLAVLILGGFLAFCTPTHAEERIISKADTDRIFSMRKSEWEAYAPRVAHEGWKVMLRRIDTGAVVMAFDPATGIGLSVQPLYIDDSGPPVMLVVLSFYPLDRLPPNLAGLTGDIGNEAQRDLGSAYKVSSRYVKLSPSLEGIELTVARLDSK
jgi:hypothetical protein